MIPIKSIWECIQHSRVKHRHKWRCTHGHTVYRQCTGMIEQVLVCGCVCVCVCVCEGIIHLFVLSPSSVFLSPNPSAHQTDSVNVFMKCVCDTVCVCVCVRVSLLCVCLALSLCFCVLFLRPTRLIV